LVEFESGWNAIFTDLVPGIGELIARIADRVRLLALSNTNATHATYWKARYAPVFERFERVFCSHELSARKPEHAAYAAIAEYANVSPHRIVFFDDVPEFVEGARRFGLRSFLAEGCPTIEAPLVRLGVLPATAGPPCP
jgi:putative hydrolase of the HAD superfamily